MSANKLILAAPAKINWGLEVLGQREDGYHLLRSVMQSVSLCDRVELEEAEADACYCEPAVAGTNLAFTAWLLLKKELGLERSLSINIEKSIPIGGGLGGGSADAAAVLRGANQLLDLGLSDESLAQLGLRLGADVPFCLRGGLMLAEGVGERLTPLSQTGPYYLTLVNPGFPVSTAQVYGAWKPGTACGGDIPGLIRALAAHDVEAISRAAGNSLARGAEELYPGLAALSRRLEELGRPALLSGSGATMWVLGQSWAEAAETAAQLRGEYPWTRAVRTQ